MTNAPKVCATRGAGDYKMHRRLPRGHSSGHFLKLPGNMGHGRRRKTRVRACNSCCVLELRETSSNRQGFLKRRREGSRETERKDGRTAGLRSTFFVVRAFTTDPLTNTTIRGVVSWAEVEGMLFAFNTLHASWAENFFAIRTLRTLLTLGLLGNFSSKSSEFHTLSITTKFLMGNSEGVTLGRPTVTQPNVSHFKFYKNCHKTCSYSMTVSQKKVES